MEKKKKYIYIYIYMHQWGSQCGGCSYGYRLKFWLFKLRLSVNFFQLGLTTKLKINFFCFKELNVNKPVFFVSLKQNKGLRIISGWNKPFFWKILTFDRSYFFTLVPEVFLDFSSRKRSRGSREAATTSRESDEEREKNLWLPWPRISLSCRRHLSNASNC